MKNNTENKPLIDRAWHFIDADGAVLGKIAVDAANLLRGRRKVGFKNHLDLGDMVVITNASKIKLTGNKLQDKTYYSHSMYSGGLKSATASKVMETKPENIIISAISGMLPKNKLRDVWLKRLRVYPEAEHPHAANVTTEK